MPRRRQSSGPSGGSALSTRQLAAIDLLMLEPSVTVVSKRVEVAERTLYRWLATDTFTSALADARRTMVARATARLQSIAFDAVGVLHELMVSKTAQESVRLAASKAVIEYTYRGSELEDVIVKLRDLQRVFDERLADYERRRGEAPQRLRTVGR